MSQHIILGAIAFTTGALSGALVLISLGIRKGDRAKRLTSRPGSQTEVLALRSLVGSRGYQSSDESEG